MEEEYELNENYRNIQECLVKYLKRNLMHYRELKFFYIFIHLIVAVVIIAILIAIASLICYEDDEWWDGILFGISIFANYLLVVCLVKWEDEGAIPNLMKKYEKSRFIWDDCIRTEIKGEGYIRWFYALISASINVCGERDYNNNLLRKYEDVDGYIKKYRDFIDGVWYKYNCDRMKRQYYRKYGIKLHS